MNPTNKNFIHNLKFKPKDNVAIIGSSLCSCLLGNYLKTKFGTNVTYYEKTKFIGGAWRSDEFGNIFSNILAPITLKETKIFGKVLNFLKKEKTKPKKTNLNSFYAGKIVNSYFFDLKYFYEKIKKNNSFRILKVNSIIENDGEVVINNKFKHDYVLFTNYVDLKKLAKNSSPFINFKIPKKKIIRSKHIRIFYKHKNKNKLNDLFYNEKKLSDFDRLQIIEFRKNLYKASARVALESKKKSKIYLINSLTKLLGAKNIFKINIGTYASVVYNILDIKKINLINGKFNRIKHYDTSSVVGFIQKYLL